MTYHEDEAVLSRPRLPWGRTEVAFGWLEPEHDYPRGPCPPEVLTILEREARAMSRRSRGWHLCRFCPPPEQPGHTPYVTGAGDSLELGSALIELPGAHRRLWLAPNLVLHYVVGHGHAPPRALVEDVRRRAGR